MLAVIITCKPVVSIADNSSSAITSLFKDMGPISKELQIPDDSAFQKVGVELSALEKRVDDTSPGPHQEALFVRLHRDLGMLDDAYRLWSSSLSLPKRRAGTSSSEMPISADDDFVVMLKQKYGDDASFAASEFENPNRSSLMITLAASASYDSTHMGPEIASAASQGAQSLTTRFPIRIQDAKDAIAVGRVLDKEALFGNHVEWFVSGDIANEGDGAPSATVETPFFQTALLAASRKARYESAPSPSDIVALNLKTLIVDVDIESHQLHAFDDTVCIVKQNGSFIRASSKNVSSPSVVDGGKYAYDFTCKFAMRKFDSHEPYDVTLANLTIFDVDHSNVRTGEVHFHVDPDKMR